MAIVPDAFFGAVAGDLDATVDLKHLHDHAGLEEEHMRQIMSLIVADRYSNAACRGEDEYRAKLAARKTICDNKFVHGMLLALNNVTVREMRHALLCFFIQNDDMLAMEGAIAANNIGFVEFMSDVIKTK